MSGLRQVEVYLTKTYDLPVKTPIRNLRPARETCEECHWPEKLSGNLLKQYTHYMRDEENTPYSVRLMLKVGGGQGERATGIHWHISSGYKIQYVATDFKRLTIPYVKMTDPDGKTTVFKTEDCDPGILDSTFEVRTMDCIDCHNRPSHIFQDPEKLVNEAMSEGSIDIHLPSIKDTAMSFFEEAQPSTEAALKKIDETLREQYLSDGDVKGTTLEDSVNRAVKVLQGIYQQNFFPEMGVDWTTHPNFAGHFRWDGCYRCHDGGHKSEDGQVISHDCKTCHLIIGQGEGFDSVTEMPYEVQEFTHPMDMGPLDEDAKCTDCHGAPDPTDYHEVAASD